MPLAEMALALVNAASIVAAIETGHWFAAPFAALFMLGYGYVATLVIYEQVGRPLPEADRVSSEPAAPAEASSMARAA